MKRTVTKTVLCKMSATSLFLSQPLPSETWKLGMSSGCARPSLRKQTAPGGFPKPVCGLCRDEVPKSAKGSPSDDPPFHGSALTRPWTWCGAPVPWGLAASYISRVSNIVTSQWTLTISQARITTTAGNPRLRRLTCPVACLTSLHDRWIVPC